MKSLTTGAVVVLLITVSCQPTGVPGDALVKIILLEDQRNADMSEFSEFLNHDNAVVRARACLALGRIGLLNAPDPFRQDLERLLKEDPSEKVRAMAAFALGEAQEGESVETLKAALQDSSPRVRELAAEALTKTAGSEVVETLMEQLQNEEDVVVKERILLTSWKLGDDVSIGPARNILIAGPAELRRAAAFHLMRHQNQESIGIASAAILQLADNSDPQLRKAAARLVLTTEDQGSISWVLDDLLADDDISVKIHALRVGASIGYPKILQAAIENAANEHPHLRLESASALARLMQIAVQHQVDSENIVSVVEALRLYVKDPEDAVVAAAVRGFMPLGQGSPLAASIDVLLDDDRPLVRAAAVGTVPLIGGEDLWQRLDKALQDENSVVRIEAAQAITSLSGEEAMGHIVELLEDEDPVIVSIGASYLQQNAAAEGLPGLLQALDRFKNDDNVEALQGIVQALSSYRDDEQALAAVEKALEDSPHRIIRLLAAGLLADSKGPEVWKKIGIMNSDRDEAFYSTALETLGKYSGITIKTTKGDISLKFYPDDAPLTVYNIISLAQENYFDGMTIHRVVPDFVAQMGCPRGDGWGGPGYDIRCEINTLRYERGMVGMALAGKDTGGSQLFITLAPQPHLDGGYTIFATVQEGLDVAEQLLPGDGIISTILLEAE
jgi:cyclophilin family peptidyl-prolyl cis-trans isomerase